MQVRQRLGLFVLVGLAFLILGNGGSFAAPSPFGVALPETSGPAVGGLWGDVQAWILAQQSDFYLALKTMVRAISDDPLALMSLLGLSFAYGAFHAAGPGHGKVVLTTYLFASGSTARRGAILALIAAMVQASVAVVLIGIAAVVLNLTSIVITQTAMMMELASYALFVVLGGWLLSRAWRAAFAMRGEKPGHNHSHDHHDHDHHDHHGHHHHHDHSDDHHGHHHHDDEDGACSCGHSHAPSLEMADQARSFKAMALAVFSMGLRPCSGALIVLVFALSQNVFWAGVASAYAMGIGTGLTIACLALFAVYARSLSQRLAGRGLSHRAFDWLGVGIMALAGLIVAGFGGVLLAANLL